MKFSTQLISAVFSATLVSAQAQPFAIVTRDDGTTSWVGGSAGCFGTEGNIASVSVTPGFQATFYSNYACSGQVLIQGSGQANFQTPIPTLSIALSPIGN
jgi:hypothetical protein